MFYFFPPTHGSCQAPVSWGDIIVTFQDKITIALGSDLDIS